jgi:hypothetical protein
LAQQATAPGRTAHTSSAVAGLARFFPEAAPVRIPVQLARIIECGKPECGNRDCGGLDAGNSPVSSSTASNFAASDFTESTIIEFGTPREVFFACNTPLEFSDIVRLRNSDGSLDTEASVVAVQYHPGSAVVAARFCKEVPNWIVKS